MKIIAGLGNIGANYENTYHNAGFMAADELARQFGVAFTPKPAFYCSMAEIRTGGERVVVAKPSTFMNESGKCVESLVSYYKIPTSDLLVVYDDIDIEIGSIRFRPFGSAGTHNGMRDIVARLSTTDFARVRIGTKPDDDRIPLINYVLMKIPEPRLTEVRRAAENAAKLAKDFCSGVGSETLMSRYNGKK